MKIMLFMYINDHIRTHMEEQQHETNKYSAESPLRITLADTKDTTATTVLEGKLIKPAATTTDDVVRGTIIFSHGSGSNQTSPRNEYVAKIFCQNGFGSLLVNLLTAEESRIDKETHKYRFNVQLLTKRLLAITNWWTIKNFDDDLTAANLNNNNNNNIIGYFGASTGAAAAISAAAALQPKHLIKAIVSRGGRPDLSEPSAMKCISIPILFLVGSKDDAGILGMHQKVIKQLSMVNENDRKLVLIQGAGHLFEEPGTLDEVALFATSWFKQHLSAAAKVDDKNKKIIKS
jgi:putative phosphoribosyl transferase